MKLRINSNHTTNWISDDFTNQISDCYFRYVKTIEFISFSKLVELKHASFRSVYKTNIYFPELINMEKFNFTQLSSLNMELNFPKLTNMGDFCFWNIKSLEKLIVPNLISIWNDCFRMCHMIKEFEAPNLISIGNSFSFLQRFDNIYLPNLESTWDLCFNLIKEDKAWFDIHSHFPKLNKTWYGKLKDIKNILNIHYENKN